MECAGVGARQPGDEGDGVVRQGQHVAGVVDPLKRRSRGLTEMLPAVPRGV